MLFGQISPGHLYSLYNFLKHTHTHKTQYFDSHSMLSFLDKNWRDILVGSRMMKAHTHTHKTLCLYCKFKYSCHSCSDLNLKVTRHSILNKVARGRYEHGLISFHHKSQILIWGTIHTKTPFPSWLASRNTLKAKISRKGFPNLKSSSIFHPSTLNQKNIILLLYGTSLHSSASKFDNHPYDVKCHIRAQCVLKRKWGRISP